MLGQQAYILKMAAGFSSVLKLSALVISVPKQKRSGGPETQEVPMLYLSCAIGESGTDRASLLLPHMLVGLLVPKVASSQQHAQLPGQTAIPQAVLESVVW